MTKTKLFCSCKDWEENIDKLNAPLMLLHARNPGQWGYDGKEFNHCPWCGRPLYAITPPNEDDIAWAQGVLHKESI